LLPDVLTAIEAASPHAVLFDPLDVRSGIAFLRMLRETMPGLKIVMIGMELDSELFILAVREGIAG
jgi:DNA-binding NarL/FixJ family response regulator